MSRTIPSLSSVTTPAFAALEDCYDAVAGGLRSAGSGTEDDGSGSADDGSSAGPPAGGSSTGAPTTDGAERSGDGELAADADGWTPDEEFVHGPVYIGRLLAENDGRLWQREIASATDASSSTVSRWLGELEAEDRIDRVQIGREKLVTLPDRPLELQESGPEDDEEAQIAAVGRD